MGNEESSNEEEAVRAPAMMSDATMEPIEKEDVSEKTENSEREKETSREREERTPADKDTGIDDSAMNTGARPRPSTTDPPISTNPNPQSIAQVDVTSDPKSAAANTSTSAPAPPAHSISPAVPVPPTATTKLPMSLPAATVTNSTAAAAKPAFAKKRKISPSPPPAVPPPQPPPRTSVTLQRPLVDPAVTSTVHSIMALLQTYGPLSLEQLEYNLPPTPHLHDVVQVMETLGVIQVVVNEEEEKDEDASSSSNTTGTTISVAASMPPSGRKYCMIYGKPRAEVISPQDVVPTILEAQTQVKTSLERNALLKQALRKSPCNPREVLKDILRKFPQVTNDPVYMAAFRNVHLDLASVERERLKQHQQQQQQEEKNGGPSVAGNEQPRKEAKNPTTHTKLQDGQGRHQASDAPYAGLGASEMKQAGQQQHS